MFVYFECVCVCLCVPLCVFVMFKCVVSVSALIIYAYDDIHESGRSMLMTTCATALEAVLSAPETLVSQVSA